MENTKLNELLAKYKNGTLSIEEKLQLDTWYLQEASIEKHKLGIEEVEKISREIALNLPLQRKTAVLSHFWFRLALAASIVIGLVCYFLLSDLNTNKNTQLTAQLSIISPGINGATLTLADGSKITLDQAKKGIIASQPGTKIKKTTDGQIVYNLSGETERDRQLFNTVSTAVGQQYQVILPDGTHVWLNASSSIKYPTLFTSGKREVELSGEGYFEVSHNPSSPFIVRNEKQQVQVLGTHFNINAYTDEPTNTTTLFEGKVKISNTQASASAIIKPGEKAVLDGGRLSVNPANLAETIAWKEGYFRFNGKDIESIMRMLSRWYNVEVIYSGQVTTEAYYGKISRFKNINEVLLMLENAKGVHFKVEGRRITVTK